MDPNSGSVKDAIEVTCRQDGTVWSTCVSEDSEVSKTLFSYFCVKNLIFSSLFEEIFFSHFFFLSL